MFYTTARGEGATVLSVTGQGFQCAVMFMVKGFGCSVRDWDAGFGFRV